MQKFLMFNLRDDSGSRMNRNLCVGLCPLFLALLLSACSSAALVPPDGGTQPASTPSQASEQPQATIVSLTFDDGDADNFPVGAVLKQYGMRATFYIPSGLVGRTGYMTWEQLKNLQNDGNEIGGHTLDHVNIGELDATALRHEVCDDRQNLMDHGFRPVSFAYPFGGYNEDAKRMLQDCGYSDGRTILGGPEKMPPSDAYALLAFPYIVVDTEFGKLQRYVAATRKEGGGWVILVFHHVCESCDYFSVKPDVLNKFILWLAEQQSIGHIKVKTVGEVVLDAASP